MTRDEWNRLPPKLKESLVQSGLSPDSLSPKIAGKTPYTRAGVPSLKGERSMPDMSANLGGVTISEGFDDSEAVPTSTNSFIAYNPANMKGEDADMIRAHEMEHALDLQGGGQKIGVNERWDKLRNINEDAGKYAMVKRLASALPHLQKEWGLPKGMMSGYFNEDAIEKSRNPGLYLSEMFATLSALEQARNRRLTDDPYMQKHVFKTPGERETYNAVTGLRQTRLDAKDLPPYTRQPERQDSSATGISGLMQRARSLFSQ